MFNFSSKKEIPRPKETTKPIEHKTRYEISCVYSKDRIFNSIPIQSEEIPPEMLEAYENYKNGNDFEYKDQMGSMVIIKKENVNSVIIQKVLPPSQFWITIP